MWFAILLTIIFAVVFARILVNAAAEEITKNWKAYRCDPHVMMFAGMFKNKDDPRSDSDFATDNFEYCSSEIAKSALQFALKPVMDVFYQMSNSAIASIGVTMNLRTLGANLFHGLNRMFDVFTRRFNLTFHELHMSFIKQYTAIQKANGVATAAVFQGISVIRGIMNFFNLMITVVIAILVILVIMTIFLFFLLAPVIPLILVTVGVVAAAGGAVGGMAGSFCFGPETELLMADGTVKRIDCVAIGDILKNGAEVNSVMKFKTDKKSNFKLIDGILVSGSHIIFDVMTPNFVEDYEDAVEFNGNLPSYVYCLNTSTNTIPIKGISRSFLFADWEELGDDDMEDWDKLIRGMLNESSDCVAGSSHSIEGESGFSPESILLTKKGYTKLRDVKIGDTVFDSEIWTEVLGVVKLSKDDVTGRLRKLYCNGSSWVKENNKWIRAAESQDWVKTPVSNPLSLFTKSGKMFINNEAVRDFSDIGLDNIHKTYDFTLSRLLQKCSSLNR